VPAKEGSLADKSTELILAALSRAIADPHGLSLHGRKASSGMFAATSGGRLAAQRAKDEGYLQVLRTQPRGKAIDEICAITEKGVAYLLSQVNPKQVLEDFIRSLESKQHQTGELLTAAHQMNKAIESLKETAERVLAQVQAKSVSATHSAPNGKQAVNGDLSGMPNLLPLLARWNESLASEDCPLPELYRQLCEKHPGSTIGQFHDELRKLHEQTQIYLHPWTGPLYAIPEPSYALLIGHEIAYYASLRKAG
jgi:DNA-binding PadR family transcriptional regulator